MDINEAAAATGALEAPRIAFPIQEAQEFDKDQTDALVANVEAPEPEDSPPVLSVLDNPPPLEGESNAFGAITLEPIRVISENHNKNFVRIFIYECSGRFYFGYQLKVDRIIRQKKANVADPSFDSAESARMAARDEIKGICGSSRFVQDIFEDFITILYNQPELF